MSLLYRLLLYACHCSCSKIFRHDCDFSVLDGSTLSLGDFEEKRRQQMPLLIINLTDTWPAMNRWLSPQFQKNYREAPLPQFDRYEPRLNLGQYLDREDRPRFFGQLGVKRFAMPWLRNDFKVPEALVGVFEDPILFFGGASSRRDVKDIFFQQLPETWMSLVSGRHRWFLQKPQSMKRYRSAVQFWTQDTLEQETSFRCTQHAGDTVYLPESWWSASYVMAADSANLSVGIGGSGDSWPVMAASVYGTVEAVTDAAGPWKKQRKQSIKEANRRHVLPVHVAQNVAVLEFLHKYGADVNAETDNGDTPLIEATRSCLLPNMEWLVGHGANLSHRNSQGMTAFQIACTMCQEVEFVEFLLKQSADVNEQGASGVTPLRSAIASGNLDIAKWLVKQGADFTVQRKHGTPWLQSAAVSGNERMMTWVMSQGARVDDTDSNGDQAIHVAAEFGRLESMRYLVEHRADIRASVTERYMEPVHFAVMGGHVSVLSWLKENGADLKANMSGGLTPLGAANEMVEKNLIPYEVVSFLAEATQTSKDEL